MAVQPFEIMREDPAVRVVKWVLGNGDTGRPIPMWHYSDRTIQVYGVFGVGGSVQPEGSNEIETSALNWFQLRSPGELPITLTSAGGKQILEYTYLFRPHCTAGDGSTSITVLLCTAAGGRGR